MGPNVDALDIINLELVDPLSSYIEGEGESGDESLKLT